MYLLMIQGVIEPPLLTIINAVGDDFLTYYNIGFSQGWRNFFNYSSTRTFDLIVSAEDEFAL